MLILLKGLFYLYSVFIDINNFQKITKMAKSKDTKKEVKKEPLKTPKEKKAEKKLKKPNYD